MKDALKVRFVLGAAGGVMALCAVARDPDDQIRYAEYMPCHHAALVEMGFNLYDMPGIGKYDFAAERPEPPGSSDVRGSCERLAHEGAEAIVEYKVAGDRHLMETYPRLGRDGTPLKRKGWKSDVGSVDPAIPACRSAIAQGAKAVGAACAALGVPNVVGFRGLEEVRVSSLPSLGATAQAAYRSFAGTDIPVAAEGRAAPHWSKIADFPKDRLLDPDYPLLKYYKWFWQEGDGWSPANDAASAAFSEGLGRPAISVYAPALRMPYLWGIAGRNTHLSDWIYVSPHPFNIRYRISELKAAARGTGAAIVPTVDGVVYSQKLMPDSCKPSGLPGWYAVWGKRKFATIPADWALEAFWLMCSRQCDGIGLAVVPAVLGDKPGGNYWAPKTNDEAADAVRSVMTGVARPLGPLLRNMPERVPEVAILASYASALFSTSGAWDWSTKARAFGELMVLANLDQYTLFEEEIERDGIPPSVKVVLMPECEVLMRRTAEQLREFQRRGGRLIAEARHAPGINPDAELPDCSSVLPVSSNLKGGDGLALDAKMRAKAAEVKALVGVPLYAETANDAILLTVRSFGSADVVFAVNDRRQYGPYLGGWKTVLDKGVANKAELLIRRPAGAVYDLVKHAPVPFSSADGQTCIPVSYETCDGRALMVTARPLAPLAVEKTSGGLLRVTSTDRDVMVPFGVYAANGKLLQAGILRNGVWERSWNPEAFEVVDFATGLRTPVVRRVAIGMCGFSSAVCNETGVRRLKAIGADFASGVRYDDKVTLDLFLKYGLRAEVGGLPKWWGGSKETPPGTMAEKRPVAEYETALTNFVPHFAMRSVALGDEPSLLDFAYFSRVNDFVQSRCGSVRTTTTLFPDYGSYIRIGDEEAWRLLGTDSYDTYVRTWCKTVRGQSELAIDYYPFSAPEERRPQYFLRRFKTLEAGAKCARERGLSYSLYVQANSYFAKLEMTLPRLRYQAFSDLAYGAESLFFTCYTPSWWKHNILTAAGEPTARYYAVQRLIQEIRQIDDRLMRYRWLGVRYLGFSEDEVSAIGGSSSQAGYATAFADVRVGKGSKFLVGDFVARDGSGRAAALLVAVGDPDGSSVKMPKVTIGTRICPYLTGTRECAKPSQDKDGAWTMRLASDRAVLVEERE